MLLTYDKINLSHFASRKRYRKDDTGTTVCVGYDRLLIGLRVKGREWLESHYTNAGDTDIATVFMLGDKNVVFTWMKGDATMYVNTNAGAQAMEYAKYWATANGCEMEFVDDLPTAEHAARTSTPKTLDDLVEKAMTTTVDCGL